MFVTTKVTLPAFAHLPRTVGELGGAGLGRPYGPAVRLLLRLAARSEHGRGADSNENRERSKRGHETTN